mmetsp:Transcript_22786/g.66342  ORF Transcript_22786/g.66342 Transcript_22786/m.66342 type:complete len:204 (+) Transcript_22786:862-1473(+)
MMKRRLATPDRSSCKILRAVHTPKWPSLPPWLRSLSCLAKQRWSRTIVRRPKASFAILPRRWSRLHHQHSTLARTYWGNCTSFMEHTLASFISFTHSTWSIPWLPRVRRITTSFWTHGRRLAGRAKRPQQRPRGRQRPCIPAFRRRLPRMSLALKSCDWIWPGARRAPWMKFGRSNRESCSRQELQASPSLPSLPRSGSIDGL